MSDELKSVKGGTGTFNCGGTHGVDVGVGVCGEFYMECTRTVLEQEESMQRLHYKDSNLQRRWPGTVRPWFLLRVYFRFPY